MMERADRKLLLQGFGADLPEGRHGELADAGIAVAQERHEAGRGSRAYPGLMKASNCLHRFCCAVPSRSDDAMVAVGFNPRTVNTPKGIASGHRAQHGR